MAAQKDLHSVVLWAGVTAGGKGNWLDSTPAEQTAACWAVSKAGLMVVRKVALTAAQMVGAMDAMWVLSQAALRAGQKVGVKAEQKAAMSV